MYTAQEADGESPHPAPICKKCSNACPACFRCELSYDDYRDIETVLAPGDIIIDCNKFIERELNEEKTISNDDSEGVHVPERRILPDGMSSSPVEWEEDEENGQIHIRVRVGRKAAQRKGDGKETEVVE